MSDTDAFANLTLHATESPQRAAKLSVYGFLAFLHIIHEGVGPDPISPALILLAMIGSNALQAEGSSSFFRFVGRRAESVRVSDSAPSLERLHPPFSTPGWRRRIHPHADGIAPGSRERSGMSMSMYALNLGVLVLAFITSPLLSRLLGPTGRGEVAAVLAITTLVPWIAEFGLASFLTRESARTEASLGELVGTVMFVGLFAMSRPTLQLLTFTLLKVHSQFQFMNMAVLQLLNVKLRVVNCWLPKNMP